MMGRIGDASQLVSCKKSVWESKGILRNWKEKLDFIPSLTENYSEMLVMRETHEGRYAENAA